MIDALISNPTVRMLEQTLSFTEQRHNLLLEDIANASVPGAVQKDVSVGEFQQSLRKAINQKRASANNVYEPESGRTVSFEPGRSRVTVTPREEVHSVAFHDRGVRDMEYLMSELADNALGHNMAAQFLKSRYDAIGRAISMKV